MPRQEFAHLLRGIAVITVVLCSHFAGVFWYSPAAVSGLLGIDNFTLQQVPYYISLLHSFRHLNYGHLGVSLFFLISGFVIPFSLMKLKSQAFLISRFFRIYPTYWVAFTLSLLTLKIGHNGSSVSSWSIIFQYLLIRDLTWMPSLDGINWTLEVEIKFYLICAILSKVIINVKTIYLLTIVLIFCSVSVLLSNLSFPIIMQIPWICIINACSLFLFFIIYMFIGTLFCWHCYNRISTKTLIFLTLLFFFCFSVAWKFNKVLSIQYINGTLNYFISLVCFSVFYILRNFIKTPTPFKWIADISFSLYAIHPIIGYTLLYYLVFIKYTNHFCAILITFTTCVILAYIINILIEVPSNLLGKKLSKRFI